MTKEEGLAVSYERFYRYLAQDKKAGGDLHTHLRCQKKRRHRYGGLKCSQRRQIKGRVSIDERPVVVDQRSRKASQPVLVTLTERKTRYTLMIKAANKIAVAVKDKLLEVHESIDEVCEDDHL